MHRIIKITAALSIFCMSIYGLLFYQNNRASSPVENEKIVLSYEQSVAWLLAHSEEIINNGNPMLWWMLNESAHVSGDSRVQALVDNFRLDFDSKAPYSVWQAFFHPRQFRNAKFSPSEYISLVEYQQYFLYTLTCSRQLADEPLIVAQNNPDFCWQGSRRIRPACVTHQMMGFRMAQRNQCAVDNLEASIGALQNTIEKQLRYDPRVVDVYIQRLLMLVDSGARDRIKARWLRRVLDAQLADGGWSDMHPLVPAGDGKYFGFNASGVTVATPVSNFHATAQGVLLMTLLRHE